MDCHKVGDTSGEDLVEYISSFGRDIPPLFIIIGKSFCSILTLFHLIKRFKDVEHLTSRTLSSGSLD